MDDIEFDDNGRDGTVGTVMLYRKTGNAFDLDNPITIGIAEQFEPEPGDREVFGSLSFSIDRVVWILHTPTFRCGDRRTVERTVECLWRIKERDGKEWVILNADQQVLSWRCVCAEWNGDPVTE